MLNIARRGAARIGSLSFRFYAKLVCVLLVLMCCTSVTTAQDIFLVAQNGTDANPLLSFSVYPVYGDIKAEHVLPAIKVVLADGEEELKRVEAKAATGVVTYDDLFVPLERVDDRLSRVWGTVQHLLHVRNTPELRAAQAEAQPLVVQFSNRVGQSEELFTGYQAIKSGRSFAQLSQPRQRIVELAIRDAELAGVALREDARDRFNRISEELAQLTTTFSNNVMDATKAFTLRLTDPKDVAGLPPSALALAAQTAAQKGDAGATPEKGPWVITLDSPSSLPFLQHAHNSDLRRQVYMASILRASAQPSDNSPLIDTILSLRADMAGLLGFKTYTEMSLSRKMAHDVDVVRGLLFKLRDTARAAALRDKAEVQEAAGTELAHWDVPFWAERVREQRYDVKEEVLRQYFQLHKVLAGLFGLVERLFGIKVVPADGDVAVWHPDVRYFRVLDTTGRPVASFFLDPYSRPHEKQGGAWMNTLVGRSRACADPTDADGVRLPVAYMVCNSAPPIGDAPSLMSFRDVETLFHEFGHALQHMLTRVDDGGVSGISQIEWDAVELPSQFMENWCYDPALLRSMTAHAQTGAPLPDDLINKIIAARDYRAGTMTLRQVHFSLTDLFLHHEYTADTTTSITGASVAAKTNVHDEYRRIGDETLVMPPLPEDRMLCSFAHIFAGGYAAGYYSYKWAEVLSADAFAAFEEAGLTNESAMVELGHRFRDTVLSLGGSVPAMAVFEAFRGRAPDPAPLLKRCQ